MDGWSSSLFGGYSILWLLLATLDAMKVVVVGRMLLHPSPVRPLGVPGRGCLCGLEANTKEWRWNRRED